MINFNYDGFNAEITVEVWRVKEAVYKLIDRIMRFLGKGRFFIACGYCARKSGEMKCRAPGPVPFDKPCTKEGCEDSWER